MNSENHWETQPRKENGQFTFRGKINLWKKILSNVESNAVIKKIDCDAKGGSYGQLRKATSGKKDVEIHHMPSAYASLLSRWKGPCIVLDKKEHYCTASHSRMRNSRAYRQIQKKLVTNGNFLDAEIMDIVDILIKTGEKYIKALFEKLDYDLQLFNEGVING